jgi:autoinducer 2-degrading protein
MAAGIGLGGMCYQLYMLIVHVQVRVKPDQIAAFITATLENAEHSLREPGIARFDVLQDKTSPALFLFTEVYRTADAPAQHKATAHYVKWRDTVADMMAEPRSRLEYSNLFPPDERF